MHTTRFVPLAVACLLLAACDPGGTATPVVTVTGAPSAGPSAGPSETPVVTPTPEPTATFGPHPALGELQITTRGLLPLTHTDPIVGNSGEQMLTWDDDYCYSDVMGITEDTGRWIANPAHYPGNPFLTDGHNDGTVHRIDIASPDLYTPEGVHIGTTAADLAATYPGLVVGTPSYATDVYWIVDPHGFVVFETITELNDGTPVPEFVLFIRVLSTEWDPDWTVYGSGNVAGACF